MEFLKSIKKGDYFTLKSHSEPKDCMVWIKGDYDRSTKKYCCYNFADVNKSRLFPGNKEIYTDFIF